MHDVKLTIEGQPLHFELARSLAKTLAEDGNDQADLVAWCDRERNLHSPCCIHCVIGDRPGWEVYGENHGGRLRISVNDDAFVFIYS